jgi:tryptophan synthase alpha chain
MNRIDKCFQEKGKDILSIYFTAGYPALNDTIRIIKALDKHGADMVEIGMPFSDPIADGPVIQQSSKKALDNGMSLIVLFDQLKKLRQFTDIPVILMGYLNPVFKLGMEKFLDHCADVGVDGVILPDFPAEEYL